MIVALALSPSLDLTYEVDTLRRGGITRPRAITRVAGGKALNVARVAWALGASTRVIAALGGHTGDAVAHRLAADGVAATVVRLARETRTCSAIVEDDGAPTSTDLYERATPLDAPEWAEFRRRAEEAAAARPAFVAFSGSLPDGVPAGELADVLAAFRAVGARVALDSSGAGLRALAASADLLKVNRSEAAEMLGDTAGGGPDAAAAARALNGIAGADVIVTDGIRGAAALFDGREYTVAGPRAVGRFPAGSGDAFLGGLLAALDAGRDAPAALAAAAEAAERNALVPGQGLLG